MAKMNWGRVRSENRMEKYGRESLDGRLYEGLNPPEASASAQKESPHLLALRRFKPGKEPNRVICPDCEAEMKESRMEKHIGICPRRAQKKKTPSQAKATPTLNGRTLKKNQPKPADRTLQMTEAGTYEMVQWDKTSALGRVTIAGLPPNKKVKITISYS